MDMHQESSNQKAVKPPLKPQYDGKLGGSTRLPFCFDVEEYLAGHIEELNALTNAIENPSKTKLGFQRLPKHMRRRVMSHNVKRMPRRLREAHAKYLEKQNLKSPKRPSRKYRRRASNLLAEYNRRQRRHVWLETHIWHAKRFAMRALWGYKLAERANEKSYRACERALAQHCLLQDISYMVCIELCGPESTLLKGLFQHINSTTGFTTGAKFYLNGSKEGHAMFYERKRFPFGAIGKIRFLWKPSENTTDSRLLWLWSHPSYHESVRRELQNTFHLERVETVDFDTEEMSTNTDESTPMDQSSPSVQTEPNRIKPKSKKSKNNSTVERTKLALKNIPRQLPIRGNSDGKVPIVGNFQCQLPTSEKVAGQVPTYSNVEGVRMTLLKDVLNRFELRGPLSGAIIARALKLFENCDNEESVPSIPPALSSSLPSGQTSLPHLWNLLQSHSPCQFPARMVVGAVVRDPRFNMPVQRCRDDLDLAEDEDIVTLATLPSHLSHSPLWDPAIRHWCSTSKLSTHQVNQILSTRLVPGVPSPQELTYASPLPILCVQQEGIRQSGLKPIGFASGWDLIFPSGWSMPLLLALIFNGARVGALREALHLGVHMQTEPLLNVDSQAGVEFETKESLVERETYFKKPPKNRPNYIRLGVPSPFTFPWSVLLSDWATNTDARNLKTDDPKLKRDDQRLKAFESMDVEVDRDVRKRDVSKLMGKEIDKKVDLKTPVCQIPQMKGNDYYVLRDRKLIESINLLIGNIGRQNSNSLWTELETLFNSIPQRDKCLLQVSLQTINRGTLGKYSHICLPKDSELLQSNYFQRGKNRKGNHTRRESQSKLNELSPKCGGFSKKWTKKNRKSNLSKSDERKQTTQFNKENDEKSSNRSNLSDQSTQTGIGFHNRSQPKQSENTILEPAHADPNRPIRKHLRAQHKLLLARLRRRRVRAKKRGPGTFENPRRIKRKVSPSLEVVEAYREVMERLWVPEVVLSGTEIDNENEIQTKTHRSELNKNVIRTEANVETKISEGANKDLIKTEKSKGSSHSLGEKVKQLEKDSKIDEENSDKLHSKELENYLLQVSGNTHDTTSKRSNEDRSEDDLEKTDNLLGTKTGNKRSRKVSEESIQFKRVKDRLSESCSKDVTMETNETDEDGAIDENNDTENTLDIDEVEGNTEIMDTTDLEQEATTSKTEKSSTSNPRSQNNSGKSSKSEKKPKTDSGDKIPTKTHSVTSQFQNFSSSDVINRIRPIRSLRFVASHEIIGFVTSRKYHATAACGQGCVTLNGFLNLVKLSCDLGVSRVLVLVRERGQVTYHWAGIVVV